MKSLFRRGWKIVAIMRAAALLSGECALVDDASNREKIGRRLDLVEEFQTGLQSLGVSGAAGVAPSDLAEIFCRVCGHRSDVGRTPRTEASPFLLLHRQRRPSAEHQRLEQRVACQPVGAMHAC